MAVFLRDVIRICIFVFAMQSQYYEMDELTLSAASMSIFLCIMCAGTLKREFDFSER